MKVIEGLMHEIINSIIIKGNCNFKLQANNGNLPCIYPLINIRTEHLILIYRVLRNALGGKRPFFCAAV